MHKNSKSKEKLNSQVYREVYLILSSLTDIKILSTRLNIKSDKFFIEDN